MSSVPQNHENEVYISGILARDPEIKYTTTGKCVANITVLTKIGKASEYHRCVAWEDQAKAIAERFQKDSFIKVYGRLQTRSWLDPKTDTKKYTTEIVVRDFSDGTEKSESPITPDPNRVSGTQAARAILSPAERKPITDEDIPF